MRWYVPVEPPGSLTPFVVCSWTATPTGSQLLVPDACIDVLWVSTGEMWVCGPELKAWRFELPAGTTAVGVRMRPGAAPSLFDFDASSIRNARQRLGVFVGADTERRLAARIEAAPTPDGRRAVVESYVADLASRCAGPDDFTETILECIAGPTSVSQRELARLVGLTPRHLHRRSQRRFGYGTATLERIIRFQRFLAQADAAGDTRSLARLASEAGYADHAHLARDCRSITGQTPTRFLADYFPTFPDMSDPYKTIEPFTATIER